MLEIAVVPKSVTLRYAVREIKNRNQNMSALSEGTFH